MKKIVCALLLFGSLFTFQQTVKAGDKVSWKSLPGILKNIKQPAFINKDYDITKYGAVGNGVADCTKPINDAITDCNKNGGGRVVVPKGIYLTGRIYLKSNVNLYVSKDAELKFSQDKNKYLPVVLTRFEGVECMNYSPFIYAYEETNIAVTGHGTLDGQGDDNNWWNWASKTAKTNTQKEDRQKLMEMGEKGTPVSERIFGEGHLLRTNFVQPYKCKNILIEGVTFKNSPMWFLNPVLCTNVTVKKVTVIGLGPNNDGCDPESSKDVLIDGCFFNTGDDCIAIKSGRNNDGRRINIPSENIIIRNCTMKEGHGGVVIGSEISGGVKNVFTEDCIMDSPELERALRLKTNSTRGGVIENIFFRNVSIGQVKEAVVKVNYFYEEGDCGKFTPVIKNIKVENVICKKSKYAVWVKAYDRSPLETLELKNCKFDNVEEENVTENVKGFKLKKVVINGKEVNK